MLKDNQVDVKPCFVEASDRANVASARAFFGNPYSKKIRIGDVCVLIDLNPDDDKESKTFAATKVREL